LSSTPTAIPALGAVGLLLLTAPAAWAHDDHPAAAGSPGWVPAMLRCVVLVGSAAVWCVGLLRPVTGQPSRLTRRVALLAGLLAAVGLLVSVVVTGAAPALSMAQAVLTVLVPLLLAHRLVAAAALLLTGLISYEACAGHAATEFAAGLVHAAAASVWLGAVVLLATAGRDRAAASEPAAASGRSRPLRRLTPCALAAAALVTVTGVVQAWADGLRLDTVTAGSTFGRVVAAKAMLLLVAVAAGIAMSRQRWRLVHLETSGLAVALTAGAALAAIPIPPSPAAPGVPLLRTVALAGSTVPVTVVPQRPGWNLVHAAGSDSSAIMGVSTAHTSPGWCRDPVPPAAGLWCTCQLVTRRCGSGAAAPLRDCG
jgi:uncharacterized membrane protein